MTGRQQMRGLPTRLVGAVVLLSLVLGSSTLRAGHEQRFNDLLSAGQLGEAEQEFAGIVDKTADDQQARMALGVVRFLQAIEGLAKDQYRFGLLNGRLVSLPIMRIPIPRNAAPEQISYEDTRKLLRRFARRLDAADRALAEVDTRDVKLPLFLGRVRFDIDGDGDATDAESLWKMFAGINRGVRPDQGEGFSIALDGADVHWLRGYCHLLMAFCDLGLAYDAHELFERSGHLLYPDVDTPYEFLQKESLQGQWDPRGFADLVAAVHLFNFPLVDAVRMQSAREHLLGMVDQSRLSWERALAETDDDREWVPNPDQAGVLRIRVSRAMIDGWHEVLDELEAVLQGKKLIPFWRLYARSVFQPPEFPATGTGVNVKRVFTEPGDFDLVLFATGTDAVPYLEEGPLSTPETWNRLTRLFQGEFFGFAVWFN